jgi:hypothetical protein
MSKHLYSARRKPVKQYRAFHGHEPRVESVYKFHPPKGMVILGEIAAVEYVTDKNNGGGDGKYATYRHKFDRGSILCADEKMKQQLYIIGKKIKVTSAGIEH